MNMLRFMCVATMVCLIGSTARPEDKPDYAKLIVGRWQAVKAGSEDQPKGLIIEFAKDGTIKRAGKTETNEGSYMLEGDKLNAKFVDGESHVVSVIKISNEDMVLKDKDGTEFSLKRVK
jgi:uncharacterized protein (TIGR03066 family)